LGARYYLIYVRVWIQILIDAANYKRYSHASYIVFFSFKWIKGLSVGIYNYNMVGGGCKYNVVVSDR